MIRKILIIIIFPLIVIQSDLNAKPEIEDGKVYCGYNFGKFYPGLGNVMSTIYLYNQMYGANFNYHGFLNGPMVGIQGTRGIFELRFEWIFRHGKTESTFIEPTSNTEWKLGFKTRYNTMFYGIGVHFGYFSIGSGVDMGKFKLFTKRYAIDEYDDEGWDQKSNLYGKKIILFDANLYDIMGGWIFYMEFMPKKFGIRAYYSQAMAPEEYRSSNAILTYYKFRPSNIGISLLIKLNKE